MFTVVFLPIANLIYSIDKHFIRLLTLEWSVFSMLAIYKSLKTDTEKVAISLINNSPFENYVPSVLRSSI